MKLLIEIEDLDKLWHKAVLSGFMRDEPRKPWKEPEKKLAAKWFIEKLLKES